jgi:hypothetical protein
MASDIDALLSDAATNEHLRDSNRRLSAQLAKAKVIQSEMVQAAYHAAKDAALGFAIPVTPKPLKDLRKRTPEVAIAVLSDFQLAKKTPSYDSDVCAERVNRYAEKVIEITKVQRADHPVRELRVYLLGDIVEGEMIFPGQSHLIDSSIFVQVLQTGPASLTSFLQRMLTEFETVHVESVIGNHGRIGKRGDFHPESNFDAMLYEHTKQLLRNEPRLTWGPTFTRGERHWYVVDRIPGSDHAFLLFHGDQVRGGGFAGFPWYGFGRRLAGWRNGAIPEPFTYAVCGHFHTPTRMFLNTITLWANGSTESSNTYAQEEMSAAGQPCQWLLYVHPKNGVSAEYLIHLD